MADVPDREQLTAALEAAGSSHHDYESHFLKGERDEQWPGWYAAYVLGRLGDFTSPTELAGWLEEAPSDGVWAERAAGWVRERLSSA